IENARGQLRACTHPRSRGRLLARARTGAAASRTPRRDHARCGAARAADRAGESLSRCEEKRETLEQKYQRRGRRGKQDRTGRRRIVSAIFCAPAFAFLELPMSCCHYYFAATEGGDTAFTIDIPPFTFGQGCLSEAGDR